MTTNRMTVMGMCGGTLWLGDVRVKVLVVLVLGVMLMGAAAGEQGAERVEQRVFEAEDERREFAQRELDFRGPTPGRYGAQEVLRDFGNGSAPQGRGRAAIVGDELQVLFRAGTKVRDTGMALHVAVPPGRQYELTFRLRYPESFEAGMHGKMIGMSGGRGYDGGRGDQAAANGDGWSVRNQFDARERDIRHTL